MMSPALTQRADIYGLADPGGEVRYVGYTIRLRPRFRQHIREAARNKTSTPKDRWIRALLAQGVEPELRLLARCDRSLAQAAEKRVIAQYGTGGLLNSTAGGDGNVGCVYQPDDVLDALRNYAKELGRAPTSREWSRAHERPVKIVVLRCFVTWDDALRAAGLTPVQRASRYRCGHPCEYGMGWVRRCDACAAMERERIATLRAREARCVSLYEGGMSLPAVAAAVGYRDHTSVLDVLRRLGVPRRPPGARPGEPPGRCSCCGHLGHNRRTCASR